MTLLSPDDIIDLAEELGHAGFNVGVDQCLAAQRLMLTVAAHGLPFSDRFSLATWLAPIFCGSPLDQADFYQHYQRWLVARGEQVKPELGISNGDPLLASSKPNQSQPSVSRVRRWVVMGVILLVGVGIGYILYDIHRVLTPITLHGTVLDDNQRPVAQAHVFFLGQSLLSDSNGAFDLNFRLIDLPATVKATYSNTAASASLNSGNCEKPLVLRLPPAAISTTSSPTTLTISPIVLLAPPPRGALTAIYSKYRGLLVVLAIASPLLLLGLWLFWVRLPRLQLIRWKTQSPVDLESLRVTGPGVQLFNGASFRRTAQELRRHRQVESRDLDAARMVTESARQGGWFTPVYRLRNELPDYLLLIDRIGFRDLHPYLLVELAKKLRRSNVDIECYYFHGTPQILYPVASNMSAAQKVKAALSSTTRGKKPEDNAPVAAVEPGGDVSERSEGISIDDLAARHPAHHLLIFSDTTDLFSSLSGQLHRWINRFSQWNFRAFLLPEGMFTPQNSYRVAALEESGFYVLPATESSLSRVAEIVHTESGMHPRTAGYISSSPYPDLLRNDDSRWLTDIAPESSTTSRLIAQLRSYLGRDGFYWLCACAVYPELLWDLTLYFGRELNPSTKTDEQLADLVRLPWFRRGVMPEWLRERLIAALPRQKQEVTREALWSLLGSALEKPLDGFELPYVKDENRILRASSRKKLWKRRLLKNFMRTEPSSSPLRDYVFLSFLEGRMPGKGLALPDELRRLWGRIGQTRRLVIQTVTAVMVSFAIAIILRLHPPSEPLASAETLAVVGSSERTAGVDSRRDATEKMQDNPPPTEQVPTMGTLVVRHSVESLERTGGVDALRDASEKMQNSSDNRGWIYWAGINGYPQFLSWNHGRTGSSDVHPYNLFLPWHRAYLLYFEHAMRGWNKAAAIPCWDWTSTQSHQEGIPDSFTQPQVGGHDNTLSRGPRPAIGKGKAGFTRRAPDDPTNLPSADDIQNLMSLDNYVDFSDQLENISDSVHGWVGGDMGVIASGAYDPIYYAHHCMIDRIWSQWQQLHGINNIPSDYLDKPLVPFALTVREVLDIKKLGYKYAED